MGSNVQSITLGSPRLIQIVVRCALPDFVDSDSESDLHLFACGVTEKYLCLNMGDVFPPFGDKNVKDIKDAHAVILDEEAPFGPSYKRDKTTQPLPLPPPPPPPAPAQPSAFVAGTGPPRPARRAKGCTTAMYLTTARRRKGITSENKTGCPCRWAMSSSWSASCGLSLSKTGLSYIDGEQLASALAATLRRHGTSGPGKERLDLTQIGHQVWCRDR